MIVGHSHEKHDWIEMQKRAAESELQYDREHGVQERMLLMGLKKGLMSFVCCSVS